MNRSHAPLLLTIRQKKLSLMKTEAGFTVNHANLVIGTGLPVNWRSDNHRPSRCS
ncbi:MAG: hypothetical protein LBQ77_07115 [Treponema sp.]|nr:hypothetical protein [Treponema sp.]